MDVNTKESGNALWIILLAVALLAALTATITRSTDTVEQSGNIERFRIHASDIMRHAAGVKEAVNRLRMTGIGEGQMSFDVSFLAGYTNANCTAGDCLVYGSAGGGASYRQPAADWLDVSYDGDAQYARWVITGDNHVTDISSANPELVMLVRFLKENLCTQINNMLDIPGIPTDPDGFGTTAFQGDFSDTPAEISSTEEAGCFRYDSAPVDGEFEYVFYQVLIKR